MPTQALLAAVMTHLEGRDRHPGDDYARRPPTTPADLDAAQSDPRWDLYADAVAHLEHDVAAARRLRGRASERIVTQTLRQAESAARRPYGGPIVDAHAAAPL